MQIRGFLLDPNDSFESNFLFNLRLAPQNFVRKSAKSTQN